VSANQIKAIENSASQLSIGAVEDLLESDSFTCGESKFFAALE